ncbi:WXG100 family type VII secretion target [Bacillus mycoides]|uniref:WXG100 family type VII secretion target n=1 Tax=Bacillus mycoides TaxID=1405 RepID=UPI002112A6B6|nr:WXG100 family type VII secretion target [Bacillus mycoides]MCQ6565865.1 WXG100 family type VII secretion target [Bacillus mycoides]
MGLIKITPERLEQSAKLVQDVKQTLDNMHKDLYNQTEYIASQWTGATSQNFYQMFNEAKPKIFNVNNLLDKISEELKHSAKKFREVDELDYLRAQTKILENNKDKVDILTGNASLKEGDRLGASAEGSVVDGKKPIINDGEWRMKALSGKIDLNLPYSFDAVKEDLMAGNIIGAKIEGTALENSFQTKVPILFPWGISEREVTITQKVGEGNFAVGVEEYSAKLATEVTTNKYEAEVNILHIPDFIPFIGDHDVIAKGEVGLGTAGFKVQLGAETGVYFGEAFGLGGFIKVEKTKEES